MRFFSCCFYDFIVLFFFFLQFDHVISFVFLLEWGKIYLLEIVVGSVGFYYLLKFWPLFLKIVFLFLILSPFFVDSSYSAEKTDVSFSPSPFSLSFFFKVWIISGEPLSWSRKQITSDSWETIRKERWSYNTLPEI